MGHGKRDKCMRAVTITQQADGLLGDPVDQIVANSSKDDSPSVSKSPSLMADPIPTSNAGS
jgi:hypothetical protein